MFGLDDHNIDDESSFAATTTPSTRNARGQQKRCSPRRSCTMFGLDDRNIEDVKTRIQRSVLAKAANEDLQLTLRDLKSSITRSSTRTRRTRTRTRSASSGCNIPA